MAANPFEGDTNLVFGLEPLYERALVCAGEHVMF